jgi:multisubunit Na+/H+ antiporter MnhB subunit
VNSRRSGTSSTESRRSAPARRQLTRAADIVRLGILMVGATALVVGDGPVALKVLLLLPPALGPRLLRAPPGLDLLFATALGVEAVASSLSSHGAVGWWDTLSHLVLPLLSGLVLYVGLVRLCRSRPSDGASPGLAFSALVTFSAVVILGLLWELIEWAADEALGTNYSLSAQDTATDLRADTLAAAGAAAVVVLLRRHSANWDAPAT